MEELIERYLGNADLSEFDSVEEINAYFETSNLISMFGPGEYFDAEAARLAVIYAWKEAV